VSDFWLYQGDCVEVLRQWPENSVDAVVCDPPYGLEFMGKEWDTFTGAGMTKPGIGDRQTAWPSFTGTNKTRCANCKMLVGQGGSACKCADPKPYNAALPRLHGFQSWCEEWAREALRVLKPGGHLLAFGGSRTYHRLACAIEDAGFEVRDSLMWLYATGFPKSLDVSKALDKAAGAEREVVGTKLGRPGYSLAPSKGTGALHFGGFGGDGDPVREAEITTPSTDAAKKWAGWGTALKPAHEPIILARKSLEGTVAANVQKWGTGALNIDATRIHSGPSVGGSISGASALGQGSGWNAHNNRTTSIDRTMPAGRWPANVMLDEEAAAMLDVQALASRFFYVAKTSRRERDHGLDAFPARSAGEATDREDGSAGLSSPRAGAGRTGGARNIHPTVKPVALMRQLVRLVTPPGGIVLDPFVGSGSTGMAARLEGARFVGIDLSEEYLAIAHARIAAALTLK
jgi:site-specific DNA-methyltransferase (adenine-specific)